MEKEKKPEQMNELGEFGVIEHLTSSFDVSHSSTVKAIGDDAAVLSHDKQIVVTTDILTEGIHFDLMYTPLKHLGFKAVVVNLSDVFAMNAIPKQITVSIAMSAKISVEAAEDIYKGIKLACDKYNVDLVGGDTSSSLTGLHLSITAIGEVEKDKVAYRNGARPNDLICVSGNLGAAFVGLQILKREKEVFEATKDGSQPDLSRYPYVIERQLKPEAQGELIAWLQEHQMQPTSMIDISDGLSSELLHICKSSEVGCTVYQEKVPIDHETVLAAEELGLEPTVCALNGGEDYELLFTISMDAYELVKDNEYISVIGHITDKSEGANIVVAGGSVVPLTAQGWNSFSN